MIQPPKVKFEYLWEESFLAFIKNSVGSKAYRNFYVKKGNKPHDVLRRGHLSCAFFVSSVLHLFGLIKQPSFTIARTVEKLLDGGAKRVVLNKIQPGDILIWVPLTDKTGSHNHMGFYVGGRQAVSNHAQKGVVVRHHYTFGGKRQIELALRPNWKRIHGKS